MALTTEKIHEVADEIAKQGIKPTLSNVRKSLGGGSFTTISEAMQSWRQAQAENAQLLAVTIPSDLTERSEALTVALWEAAQAIANNHLKADKEALEHKEALINGQLTEAKEAVKELEKEAIDRLAERDELAKQLDELNRQLNSLRSENERLKVEKTTAQQGNQELIDFLKEQVKGLQKKVDEQAAKLESQAASLALAKLS